MIKVDRTAVPVPAVLRRGENSLADREFKQAEAFYAAYESNRQRGGFVLTAYKHPTVRAALEDLFNGKCAYCESSLDATGFSDIEQFRPKAGVISDTGEHLPLHYWWLSNEWSNLYLSCVACNRMSARQTFGGETVRSGKGGRFPLADEATRAPIMAGPAQLAMEERLLLDPCEDDVERILIFSPDGLVTCKDPRGLTTIELLGLNREALVEERRRTAERFQQLYDLMSRRVAMVLPNEADLEPLRALMSNRAPYASLCRQLFNLLTDRLTVARAKTVFSAMPESEPETITEADQAEGRDALAAFQIAQESYSLEADPGPSTTLSMRSAWSPALPPRRCANAPT